MIFSSGLGSLPHVFVYNLSNPFGKIFFSGYIILLLLLIYFEIKLIALDRKHLIFRKKYYCPLFLAGYLIIAAAMCISAYFTTKFTPRESGGFEIRMNMLYYFAVFMPVFFGYVIFCYYAYMKSFFKLYNNEPLSSE